MSFRIPRRVVGSVTIEVHKLLERSQAGEPLSGLLAAGLALGNKSGYEPLKRFCHEEIANDVNRIATERPRSRHIQTIKIIGATAIGGGTYSRSEDGILGEILQQPDASTSADLHFASIATTEEAIAQFEATEKLGTSVSISGRRLDAGLYDPQFKGIPVFVITPSRELREFLSRMRQEFSGHLLGLASNVPKWALRVSHDKPSFLDKMLSILHQIGVAWIMAIAGPLTLLGVGLYLYFKYHIVAFNVSTRP